MIERRGGRGLGGEIKIGIRGNTGRELMRVELVVAAGIGSAKAGDPLACRVSVFGG